MYLLHTRHHVLLYYKSEKELCTVFLYKIVNWSIKPTFVEYLYRIVKHFLNFCIVTMARRLAGGIHSPMIVSSVAHNGSRIEQRIIYNLHYALIRQNNEITNVINLYVTRARNYRLYIVTLVFRTLYCILYNTPRNYENT